MDVSDILSPLNDAQRTAVAAEPGPMLVLAGAGSGKTRVLTHRIAWLVRALGVSPWAVLAVTFTNKAAGEMRARTEQLLGQPLSGFWIGTFHGLAHRFLRQHWREARLAEGFQILDADDQLRLVKRTLKNLELDETRWPPRQVTAFINGHKEEGRRPRALLAGNDPAQGTLLKVYSAYEEARERAGLLDFAELLLRAHETLRDTPELLAHYRHRFQHILVDEFQDTNSLQYAWLRLLAGDNGLPFIVGDDDQSVYGWRGAQVGNILNFERHFPGARVVRLEQNYRSTGNILAAANALIEKNAGRLGKKLWTQDAKGAPLRLFSAFNEQEEARFVLDRITAHRRTGGHHGDCAVLYRSNAQSRVFEELLVAAGIPYRVYGGLRFFERAEVKDALAYLRLAANPDDDASFERVIAVPPRGIGERTVEQIRAQARGAGVSLWRAARDLLQTQTLAARAAAATGGFLALVEKLGADIAGLPLAEQTDHVIAHSGLLAHYQQERGEKGETRVENLNELVSAARAFEQHFEPDPAAPQLTPLNAFLSHAALEAGERQSGEGQDAVQLMTLHAAKGLEFPMVFLAGMEEGLFPHAKSAEEPARLEEERRLCYVGITRARRELYLSYAETRRLHGSETYQRPSRFLAELPPELVEEVRPRAGYARPMQAPASSGWNRSPRTGWDHAPRVASAPAAAMATPRRPAEPDAPGFRLGQRVRHQTFGSGIITGAEGAGAQARVQVNFERAGSKWLMLQYARLEPA
jgi:DNA helicase-2/ATP-dependent DNA helicase PcrA